MKLNLEMSNGANGYLFLFLKKDTVPVYQQQDVICYTGNNETVMNAPDAACKTNIVNTLYDVTKPKQQIFL